MFWIVLAVLLLLAIIGVAMFAPGSEAGPRTYHKGGIITGLLVVFVLVSLLFCVHRVGQREVGIVYSASGTVQGAEPKDSGWVFTWPWETLKTEHIGVQRLNYHFGSGNSAVSKDQQAILADVAINLVLEPHDVLRLYKRVGAGWKDVILDPRVPQAFKDVTSSYITTEITANREEIREKTRTKLKGELSKLNFGIGVQDVFLSNLGFSDVYSRAIEAKQAQVQLTEKARLEGEAAEKKARGEAAALRVKGAAIKAFPQSLQELAIKSLSKNVRLIVCTGNTCPSFIPAGIGK